MFGGQFHFRARNQGEDAVAETTSNVADLTSIPALLARNARDHGTSAAYREKEFGIWQSWNWAEVGAEVNALALGLLEMGLSEGDHVAIIGRNRPYC